METNLNNFICYRNNYKSLCLNSELSLNYYNDKKFRIYINDYIITHNLKLMLNFSFRLNINDVNILSLAHVLNLNCCRYVTNVNMLYSVYELNLTCCIHVKNIYNLKSLRLLNISGLKNIYGIHLLKKVGKIFVSYLKCTLQIKKLKKLKKYVKFINPYTYRFITN